VSHINVQKSVFVTMRLVTLATLFLNAACGETEFAGSQGTVASPVQPVTPSGSGDGTINQDRASSLTWTFACDQTAARSEGAPDGSKDLEDSDERGDDHSEVHGGGTHVADLSRYAGVPLTFRGQLCEPEAVPRDLVFIVDVSSSMREADPVVGGSCGRLRALEQVIASLPAGGGANMALVTFGSTVRASSNGFYADAASMFAAAGGSPATIVCATNGNTNYRTALDEAIRLLGASRPGANKEIYFVSDGEPNPGSDGALQASLIRSPGVAVAGVPTPATIATVMIGSANDAILREQIASRTSTGAPLHARTDASGLSQVLADLSRNGLAGGILKYRGIGAAEWTSVDLAKHLSGFNFTLPSFTIDPAVMSVGIEVLHEYQDLRGRKYSSGGKLLWNTSDSRPSSGTSIAGGPSTSGTP
jgi:hypothetical protein